jgi:membrane protein DedA with SNARE-associated domain
MFDWLVDTFTLYPHLGVAVVCLLCGLGLPLPEELVLISAGYVCFKGLTGLPSMMGACAGAILIGDLMPFLLGRIFGTRLLRLRTMRLLVNKRRLSMFDRWFRRRGDLVIFFARFVTGLRIVAYFTAGTMKMSVVRFILLDLIGIAIVVPLLVGVGYSSGQIIDEAIDKAHRAERWILLTVIACAVLFVGWYVMRKRRRQHAPAPADTYVGPSLPRDDGSVVENEADHPSTREQ